MYNIPILRMSLLLKLPPELRNIVYDNCATEIVISKKLSVKRCLQHRDIMSLRLACTQTNVELKKFVHSPSGVSDATDMYQLCFQVRYFEVRGLPRHVRHTRQP